MTTKHVVFVGIDGAQYSKIAALGDKAGGINNLDVVEAYTGGDLGTATQQPTVSGPGWSTLLTGVWANEHGVTSNNKAPVASAVMSLFERIDAGFQDAKIASIVHWGDINTGHFGDETGLTDGTSIVDYEAHGLGDQAVVDRGIALIGDEAPTFTFLHLDNPDGVGHSVGFGTAYDSALALAASQLNQIMAAVTEREAANPGEEWLVIVATDHGRSATGTSHGAQTAGERQIFIAANKEISSNGLAPQTSVAATILDFLDLDATGVQGPSLLDETAADTHVPYLVGIEPADDLQNVHVDAPLVLTLSEKVLKGEGTITIHRASDGAVVDTIDVNSSQVSISGGVVTVHHSAPLAGGTDYYVGVDAGTFLDAAGNGFKGLSGATTWNFKTEVDVSGPVVTNLAPADDAASVAPSDPLVITFDESVRKAEGTITIHSANGDVVETIDVASDAVSVDGKTVTIQPSEALTEGDYYVTVTPGAFEDLALISDKVLFSENFEELASSLISYTEVDDADDTDWTATLPDGWTRSNSDTPTGGPAEYFGWTFHDKSAWIASAADQYRSSFTKGQGIVAVADPDEYDDGKDIDGSKYKTWMKTPDFDVSDVQDNKMTLTFDSSWRPEGNQEVRLVVTFDDGTQKEILHWNSTSTSSLYKAAAYNETVTLTIDIPQGATKANLNFDMVKASNNWWWAVDNIAVKGNVEPHGNPSSAISDANAWNFTVVDETTEPVGATDGDDVLEGTDGADAISGLAGDDVVLGYGGDDTLDGGVGDDLMAGGEGNDTLRGGAGDDYLFGEAGNDILEGGAGSDSYDYQAGEGSDVIVELDEEGEDSLFFSDIDRADVILQKHGEDVEIVLADGEVVTLKGQLANGGIETIVFADGTEITSDTLADELVDRAPVTDATVAVLIDEDKSAAGTITATDDDLDTLTYTVKDGAGAANGAASIDAVTGAWTYVPTENFNGEDSFTVVISDGRGGKTETKVTVTVNPVNDAPTTAPDVSATTDEDVVKKGTIVAVDPDGDALTYAIKDGAGTTNGTVSIDGTTGKWTYTPTENYFGEDSFTVVVSDGHGEEVETAVALTIDSVNDAPVTVADHATVAENATALIDLLANDSDVEQNALSLTGFRVTDVSGHGISNATANGAFSIVDGKLSVNPGTAFAELSNGEHANVTLEYTVTDDQGDASIGTATIRIDGYTTYNIINGTSGNNVLVGTIGADRINAGDGNDTVTGANGHDIIDAGKGNDRVVAGAGDDTVDGGQGNDVVTGGAGADILSGNDGNDQLDGDAGNDTLAGGAGNDLLTGGAGADTFLFVLDGGKDKVLDFEAGVDVIDLSAVFESAEAFLDAGALSQRGGNAHIDLGDGSTITFVGVDAAELTIDHFRFG